MIKIFIDLGTTNIKIEIYKNEKNIESISKANKDIYFDNENLFCAEKLFDFLRDFCIDVNKKYNSNILIVFSSAMHTILFLNNNYEQIGKGRTLIENISFDIPNDKKELFRSINGLVNSSFLPIYKIKYQTSYSFDHITTLKSYILYKFSGKKYIEISDASALGVVDCKNLNYSSEILDYINLNEVNLPKILTKRRVFKTQINNFELSIDLGISDGAAAAIGSVTADNEVSLSVGTTLGIRYISDSFVDTKYKYDYCFPIYNNKYIYGISSSNGGNNIELIAKQMNIKLDEIESLDFSKCKLLDVDIYFFLERFEQKILNIEDIKIDINVLYTYIYQLFLRISNYKKIIESIKGKTIILKATGGIFNNKYILSVAKKILGDDIIISNKDNLSVIGLIKIVQHW
ncbi:FGGY family carbohydrate kinase [Spiroplasma diminutum]|uniref:Gluconate kinase n=1 Tax=Spiroplasma diminutum CUAS-1 TaxID=1276221 RepID=S5MJS7_9MOLU|nr:FGGY family carbohydrate kinase [Spiroplasma diminutum]AGR42205.1 gluconate kinase [Spiroplasma diminutum CUAS-1]